MPLARPQNQHGFKMKPPGSLGLPDIAFLLSSWRIRLALSTAMQSGDEARYSTVTIRQSYYYSSFSLQSLG